jgi:hypothetical protein
LGGGGADSVEVRTGVWDAVGRERIGLCKTRRALVRPTPVTPGSTFRTPSEILITRLNIHSRPLTFGILSFSFWYGSPRKEIPVVKTGNRKSLCLCSNALECRPFGKIDAVMYARMDFPQLGNARLRCRIIAPPQELDHTLSDFYSTGCER